MNRTDDFFMPQGLVEIQVEQPEQEDDFEEYPEFENRDDFMVKTDVCLSWTFSVTQSSGSV